VRVRRLDVEAVLARLGEWAAAVGARPEVIRVVLFGSLADGTWSAASDADVLVLVHRHPAEGPLAYRPAGPLGIGLDLFVRTPDELAAMGERFNQVVARGRVLAGRGLPAAPDATVH
jgi:predicted nucleotidyltransferase